MSKSMSKSKSKSNGNGKGKGKNKSTFQYLYVGPPTSKDTPSNNSSIRKEQWRRLSEWHEFLSSEEAQNYQTSNLEESWQLLKENKLVSTPESDRGGEILRDLSIIELLFEHIENNRYPPPEILLALYDLWLIYLANEGKYLLSEVFIAGSTSRAGNKAISRFKDEKRLSLLFEYEKLKTETSVAEASEAIANDLGPEPENVARTFRDLASRNKSAKLIRELLKEANAYHTKKLKEREEK